MFYQPVPLSSLFQIVRFDPNGSAAGNHARQKPWIFSLSHSELHTIERREICHSRLKRFEVLSVLYYWWMHYGKWLVLGGPKRTWEYIPNQEGQKDAPPFAAIIPSIQVLCLATSAYTPYNPSWERKWEILGTVKNHSQQHIHRSSWKSRPSRVFWWGRSSQWGVLRYLRGRCSCLKLVTRLDELHHS